MVWVGALSSTPKPMRFYIVPLILVRLTSTARRMNQLKKITEITNQYQSLYKASKVTGVHQEQLARWVRAGALVDKDGQVWIKTKGKLNNGN